MTPDTTDPTRPGSGAGGGLGDRLPLPLLAAAGYLVALVAGLAGAWGAPRASVRDEPARPPDRRLPEGRDFGLRCAAAVSANDELEGADVRRVPVA